MSKSLLDATTTALCPHGGQILPTISNLRVFINGQPVLVQDDAFIVVGCPFYLSAGSPHPCVGVRWIIRSARIFVKGKPVILQNNVGICFSADQSHQGPSNIILVQNRVRGI